MKKKINFKNLPTTLPIFPLPGAILLPHGNLPLNIFEPRYVAMIEDALGKDRIIGMIQPKIDNNSDTLYPVGCAGRITSFSETSDSRYLIELEGVIRFKIKKEINLKDGYRNVIPNWNPYIADLENIAENLNINDLLKELRIYFEKNSINVDFNELSKISIEHILAAIPQICSFNTTEKQAIIEAQTEHDRVDVITSLLKMYSSDGTNQSIN